MSRRELGSHGLLYDDVPTTATLNALSSFKKMRLTFNVGAGAAPSATLSKRIGALYYDAQPYGLELWAKVFSLAGDNTRLNALTLVGYFKCDGVVDGSLPISGALEDADAELATSAVLLGGAYDHERRRITFVTSVGAVSGELSINSVDYDTSLVIGAETLETLSVYFGLTISDGALGSMDLVVDLWYRFTPIDQITNVTALAHPASGAPADETDSGGAKES